MAKHANDTLDAASNMLREALGDWWQDKERRRWCAYCGIAMILRCAKHQSTPPKKATRDHVIPKKHNGNGLTIPACFSCNQAKGASSLQEFLLSPHFAEKRKQGSNHKWSVGQLWLVASLAALLQARTS